ncbi:MAG: diphthine-ammonia ligase [Candidatus Methanomethylophilaceae archaeon]|nr:diphthine-ammonia ligase [Candidatus Methanomethylophilaceae archaeon]
MPEYFKVKHLFLSVMRLASLFSGGKDSLMSLYLMEQQGHDITVLVNIAPRCDSSFMFHTPNLHLLPLMAKSMGKTLVQAEGGLTEEEDLDALEKTLSTLDVEGVIIGAIASDYQWDRVNRVCEKIGLKVFAPMWRKAPDIVLREMIDADVRAVFVAVMAEGLEPSWLGRELDMAALEELNSLSFRYGINVAGEGGEYETLVLDSPLYSRPLVIDMIEESVSRDSAIMRVTKAHLGSR